MPDGQLPATRLPQEPTGMMALLEGVLPSISPQKATLDLILLAVCAPSFSSSSPTTWKLCSHLNPTDPGQQHSHRASWGADFL